MSDRMTDIAAPCGAGLMEWGRKTRPEMIAAFRRYYQRQLEEAQAALATPDDNLRVTTFVGPWAMKNREEVRS